MVTRTEQNPNQVVQAMGGCRETGTSYLIHRDKDRLHYLFSSLPSGMVLISVHTGGEQSGIIRF
ncbi:hypothetical protein [Methanogenium cariaci]|uniref:hypothetical protein n=1 Tax=Methanogenium cariaci TaxID=2197 RepID=UPI0007806FCB|nr:hypothetical protein [Methanogenium cariaci]